MRVDFYYPEIEGIEIPEKNLLGVYKPKSTDSNLSLDQLLMEALENPVGCRDLRTQLTPGDRVLILADDNTRTTPVADLVRILLPYLHQMGIKKEDITILVALGTHRPMSNEELITRFGKQVVSEYKILNHLYDRADENIYYGKTSKGVKVWGNRRLKEADFIIGLGHIVPHRVAGFSGGAKIVQPGVSAGSTTGETHWLSALFSGLEIMGKRDNPVREAIDESGRLMGLNFIINVVQDLKGKITGVFAGDLVEAHRAGCEMAKEIYGVKIPKADIVITDSYPADNELWQAAKGIYSAELVIKEGGYIILVTPCPEGVAKTHPEVEEFGYLPLKEVEALIKQRKLIDLSVAAHLVHVGRTIKEMARGILVCPNIPTDVQERLGFVPAATPQEALNQALAKMGANASIALLLHAGEILPIN